MNEDVIYTLHVAMLNRWYPKGKKEVQHNDWQINRVKVVKKVEIDDDFETEYGQITLVGNMVAMDYECTYLVRVIKEFNEKYKKLQYKVVYSQEYREFNNERQIRDFLLIFITPRQVEALYKINSHPLELIDSHNVEELCKAAGIGEATAERIITRYEACKDYGPSYVELNRMGLTKNLVDKLIEHYKSVDTVLQLVKENPYVFADDITGIGFKKADEIALNNGVHKHDIKRVKAFIIYTLQEIANSYGSTYVYYEGVMDKIDEFLGRDTPQDTIDDAIDELIDSNKIWCRDKEYQDGTIETILALKKFYDIEKTIANDIKRLVNAPNKVNLTEKEIEASIKLQEAKQGWDYTDPEKWRSAGRSHPRAGRLWRRS